MKIPALVSSIVLALCTAASADDTVSETRIKVFLFAEPAFYSQVQVDAVNNTCVSLQNNLYVTALCLPNKTPP
jgi:hypothetical protein